MLDAPYVRPLPATPFAMAYWKRARLNIEYHIEFDSHYYSVPKASFARKRRYELPRAPSRLSLAASARPAIQEATAKGSTRRSVFRCRQDTEHMPNLLPGNPITGTKSVGTAKGEFDR